MHEAEECVDVEVGAAVEARSVALSRGVAGLGPPDLCYLHKFYKPALGLGGVELFGGAKKEQSLIGYYHHVIGLDTSSSATVSAYFADLTASQQRSTSWMASGTWQISGGVYCCYDAFMRQDLRVHIVVPGGVRATLLRCEGSAVSEEVSPAAWHHASISGLLRALCNSPPLRCLRVMPPPLTPYNEPVFLEAVQRIIRVVGHEGGAKANAGSGGGGGGGGGMCALLSALLWRYFHQSRRYNIAIDFFACLQTEMIACAQYVAAAQRELGQLPEAIGTLCMLLHVQPSSVPLLRSQVALLLQCQIKAHALSLAMHCVQLCPTDLTVWLQLASVYALHGWYDLALAALNAAPLQALTELSEPRATPMRLPSLACLTDTEQRAQALAGYGGVAAGWSGSEGKAAAGEGNASALGFHLNAACGVAGGGSLTDLPTDILGFAEAQVYAILVELVNKVGWDQLLQHRTDAFLMPGDQEQQTEHANARMLGKGRHPLLRKRQCHAWLDALFRALYCDLQVFADWHHEEQLAAAKTATVEVGGVAHGDGGSSKVTVFEWTQRARLAVRLKQPAYGKAAWATVVRELEELLDKETKLEPFAREALEAHWTQACAAVMQLHAAGEVSAIPEALGAAKRLLDAYSTDEHVAPREIAEAVYQMVATHGLQAVRTAQHSIGEAHPAINHIFHDVVQWRVHGFSA